MFVIILFLYIQHYKQKHYSILDWKKSNIVDGQISQLFFKNMTTSYTNILKIVRQRTKLELSINKLKRIFRDKLEKLKVL